MVYIDSLIKKINWYFRGRPRQDPNTIVQAQAQAQAQEKWGGCMEEHTSQKEKNQSLSFWADLMSSEDNETKLNALGQQDELWCPATSRSTISLDISCVTKTIYRC